MYHLVKAHFDSKCILMIGQPRTGKTTYLYERLIMPRLDKNNRVLIVVADGADWRVKQIQKPEEITTFTGFRKISFYPELFKDLIAYKHGLLVFDDCRFYLDTDRLDYDMHRALARLRQDKIDVVAVYHGFTEVHRKFWTFATNAIIFKTTDDISQRKNVIPMFAEIAKIQKEMNANPDAHCKTIFKFR